MATLPPTAEQLARGHAPARDRQADRRYDEARADDVAKTIRSSARWQKVRKLALSRDKGLCLDCLASGRYRPAREVDHVVSVREAPQLAYTLMNLRSLCPGCHGRKSREERRGA